MQLMMKCLFLTKTELTDQAANTIDEEITGWSASYTMGSMTFKAHSNKGTGMDNTATKTSEHTEDWCNFCVLIS